MNRNIRTVILCAAFTLASAPASALNTRTWVSGTGTDQAGCGPIANPCRTLQYAHDNTSAGGEIDVKDSAGYGSLVITRAINVIADGSLGGVLAVSSGNGITVSAGATDDIVLRGLTIEGANTGSFGIEFASGRNLTVSNCTVQNFTKSGIYMRPATGTHQFVVTSTTAQGNGEAGIVYFAPPGGAATTDFLFDRLTATGNGFVGIYINNSNASGPATASVSNSLAAMNAAEGFAFSNATVALDMLYSARNTQSGLAAFGNAVVNLGRSVLVNNKTYGVNAFAGAVVNSYHDNRITGNTTAQVNATLGTATPF